MVRVVEKMHKAQKVRCLHLKIEIYNVGVQAIEYFATNEWACSNDNVEKLNKELTEVDRKTFNFDLSDLNWPDFIADYVQVEVCLPIINRDKSLIYREQGSLSSRRICQPWMMQGSTQTRCSGLRNVFRYI